MKNGWKTQWGALAMCLVCAGAPLSSRAGMAVTDAGAIAQMAKSVSEAQKSVSELQEHTTWLTNIVSGIGRGGTGALGGVLGLSDVGLDKLLDQARGLCFSLQSLMNMDLHAPTISLPSFRNGCGGFSWAGDMFFTAPQPNDILESSKILVKRRLAFQDAVMQSAVTTGMSHKERVKDTAGDIVKLHGSVEAVQLGEGDSTSLRHAITNNSLVQLRLLEETASVRELLAELVILESSTALAESETRVRDPEGQGADTNIFSPSGDFGSDPGGSNTPSGGDGNTPVNTAGDSGTFVPPWQN